MLNKLPRHKKLISSCNKYIWKLSIKGGKWYLETYFLPDRLKIRNENCRWRITLGQLWYPNSIINTLSFSISRKGASIDRTRLNTKRKHRSVAKKRDKTLKTWFCQISIVQEILTPSLITKKKCYLIYSLISLQPATQTTDVGLWDMTDSPIKP